MSLPRFCLFRVLLEGPDKNCGKPEQNGEVGSLFGGKAGGGDENTEAQRSRIRDAIASSGRSVLRVEVLVRLGWERMARSGWYEDGEESVEPSAEFRKSFRSRSTGQGVVGSGFGKMTTIILESGSAWFTFELFCFSQRGDGSGPLFLANGYSGTPVRQRTFRIEWKCGLGNRVGRGWRSSSCQRFFAHPSPVVARRRVPDRMGGCRRMPTSTGGLAKLKSGAWRTDDGSQQETASARRRVPGCRAE